MRFRKWRILTLLMSVVVISSIYFLVSAPGSETDGNLHPKISKSFKEIKDKVREKVEYPKSTIFKTSYGFELERIRLKPLGRQKSWENEQLKLDVPREAPGEGGKAVDIPASEEAENKRVFGFYGYSAYKSNKIALDRTIADSRHPDCKKFEYYENLPSVSVILPFHNEAKSVLMRAATSLINRSPPSLIHEIIFVDDVSDYSDVVGADFEHAMKRISPKIKIVRSDTRRLGLIQARTFGYEASSGEVLVFLDAHVEVNTNWLPPLLDQIAHNYRSVPQPTIDAINEDDFDYRPAEKMDGLMRGSFDWGMSYKRFPIPEFEGRNSPADPFFNPVQCGGLFGIHRRWWEELGRYDPKLAIWGAEQYEMSFKAWMCHGEMMEVPCSRVGHVYRGRMTVTFTPPENARLSVHNMPRVAWVWMDEYKDVYFQRTGRLSFDKTGIEERIAIRERLQCKSFDWFMKNVAFDQQVHYPIHEPGPTAWGRVRNRAHMHRCLDADKRRGFSLADCGTAPEFEITWRKEFKCKKYHVHCVDMGVNIDVGNGNHSPGFYECHQWGGAQFFKFDDKSLQIRHKDTGVCLTADPQSVVSFTPCHSNDESQQWIFDEVQMSNYHPELWPLENSA